MPSAGNLTRIEQIASRLPVVHRGGFEYELGRIHGGLDFQQGIFLHDQDIRRLFEAADSVLAGTRGQLAFLQAVSAMIREAIDPASSIHPYLRQLWLEFDCRHPDVCYDRPSIFLTLVYPPADFAMAGEAVCRTHSLLTGQSLDRDTRAIMQLIFECALVLEGVSHAGFMLGREDAGLRLVLPVRDAGGLEALLTRTGCNGEYNQTLQFYRWLAGLFPEIRLCIDVKSHIVQPAGFECFFKSNDRNKPRKAQIPEIIAELASQNLCDAREAEFMMEWPGWIRPQDSPREWPDDLLLRSIGMPENSFLLLERQLSHIKFSEVESTKPIVKVYFGYVERTIESGKPVNRIPRVGMVEQ